MGVLLVIAFLPLTAAVTLFVGGHFFLSAKGIRPSLIRRLGEKGFKICYSLVVMVALVACVVAFRSAPVLTLWDLGSLGRNLAIAIMLIALLLIILADFSPNPTALAGEKLLLENWQPRGVVTITRYPFFWGIALGSIAHLLAKGNTASLILFGGMIILSFGGMLAIDGKRQGKFGDAWLAYARRTSRLPFAAADPVDWRGIGWFKPLLAVAIYIGIAFLHGWAFNRPVI